MRWVALANAHGATNFFRYHNATEVVDASDYSGSFHFLHSFRFCVFLLGAPFYYEKKWQKLSPFLEEKFESGIAFPPRFCCYVTDLLQPVDLIWRAEPYLKNET
jgi:hypothetical protein